MLTASLGSEMGSSWLKKNLYWNKIQIHGRVFVFDLHICFIYNLYTHICVHLYMTIVWNFLNIWATLVGLLAILYYYHSLLSLIHIFPNLVFWFVVSKFDVWWRAYNYLCTFIEQTQNVHRCQKNSYTYNYYILISGWPSRERCL